MNQRRMIREAGPVTTTSPTTRHRMIRDKTPCTVRKKDPTNTYEEETDKQAGTVSRRTRHIQIQNRTTNLAFKIRIRSINGGIEWRERLLWKPLSEIRGWLRLRLAFGTTSPKTTRRLAFGIASPRQEGQGNRTRMASMYCFRQ